jgi:1-acyl-sn-glycerol-3-phosphate acyltransferase
MIGRFFGWIYFRISGWRPEGEGPPYPRCVIIAAPHTSNWDLVNMLYLTWALRVDVKWLGKKSIFKFPWGWWMRHLGGIAIDRSQRQNVVAQAADLIKSSEKMCLVVPPEGTRDGGELWKSGFYHIARSANVPIVLGYLDYSRKRGGYGLAVFPTDDVVADMDKIRAFYRAEMAKFPDKFTVPRLREESPGAES